MNVGYVLNVTKSMLSGMGFFFFFSSIVVKVYSHHFVDSSGFYKSYYHGSVRNMWLND